MKTVYAAIEGGGSKLVAALFKSSGEILCERIIPTKAPKSTLHCAVKFFQEQEGNHGKIRGLGIAFFGPLHLQPDAGHFGKIFSSPKKDWVGTDVVAPFRALDAPIFLDTDVNAAAQAERSWGAACGLEDLIYLTIGTGIGGGVITRGQIVGGLGHPEIGHLFVPRHPTDDFPGNCPFHEDCVEGLASGSAIHERWKANLETLGQQHPAIEIEAWYLAHLCHTLQATTCTQRILIGGGVMQCPGLLEKVRQNLVKLGGGYGLFADSVTINDRVVYPQLGQKAGILGAFYLAKNGVEK